GGVQPIGGNPAEHAAILKAPRGGRGAARQARRVVTNEWKQVPVAVPRLREVALTPERGGQPEPVDVAATGPGAIFVTVEEEQLVGAACLAHGAAERVSKVILLRYRLRIAVPLVRPTVRIQLGVPLDVVGRAAEPVGPALGHGGDLQ